MRFKGIALSILEIKVSTDGKCVNDVTLLKSCVTLIRFEVLNFISLKCTFSYNK